MLSVFNQVGVLLVWSVFAFKATELKALVPNDSGSNLAEVGVVVFPASNLIKSTLRFCAG